MIKTFGWSVLSLGLYFFNHELFIFYFVFIFNWRIMKIWCWFLPYINMDQPQVYICPLSLLFRGDREAVWIIAFECKFWAQMVGVQSWPYRVWAAWLGQVTHLSAPQLPHLSNRAVLGLFSSQGWMSWGWMFYSKSLEQDMIHNKCYINIFPFYCIFSVLTS